MKDDSTTYDTRTGQVVKDQPVIIIKKGKRKINPLFERLLKDVPQEIKDRVDKQMTCLYLINGNECSKGLPGTPCEVVGCVAWRHYKDSNGTNSR